MSNLPLNINLTQIFLHLLNFLILFAILYFLLYKPVKNFMEKREKTYRDMDDEARDNLRVSEETKAQYESKMSEADSLLPPKVFSYLEEELRAEDLYCLTLKAAAKNFPAGEELPLPVPGARQRKIPVKGV